MIKEFSSFHNHSHFSFFDGLSRPEELLQAAKDKGIKSIALTDHGVVHGHADWYLQAKKLGVRAVFGVEAYVIHSMHEWAELKRKKEEDSTAVDKKLLNRKGHLVLLARNREGLSNLYQLVYRAHKEGFYSKPRMDKRMLREHAKGLIATTACMGGVISKQCWDMKEGITTWDEVVAEAKVYDNIFGRGHFFLELQFNEMDESQNFINQCMVKIHEETGIPLTVTTDSHYSKAEEWEPRELLHMLGWSKKTLADTGGKVETEIKQLYVKSPTEMWETYERLAKHKIDPRHAQIAFEGTQIIDGLIENFEPDVHQRLPTLPFSNPFKEMGERAIVGLKKLGLEERDEYRERLLRELSVIKKKGFANYFLTTQRMVEEAKKRMLVGPGRGSAAGSLVCYCLGITDLDPLTHRLMFERFMDEDRSEMPDIDIDYQDPDAAKQAMREIFGDDNVACLSTYGTFQIKGLLKDLGRVYDLDHVEINKMNRQIEKELRVLYVNQDKSTIVIKLEDIERVSPTFNAFVEKFPEIGHNLKMLYGRNRQVGRHASGVIIGDDLPSETAVFVTRQEDEETKQKDRVVQVSFTEGIVNKNLSAMGFIKFDMLGLATLEVIDHALKLISHRTGKSYEDLKESIREKNMDLGDMKVLKNVFWQGNFAGIFQFTEKGIRRLAQRVKPDSFVDVSAITSLYRPGPLGGNYDKLYTHNKHHPEDVSYPHPLLKDILEETRGCIVFQEQLMKICNIMGKMSMKDVNRVRKVLLKKDKSKSEEFLKKENDELRGKFLKGCDEQGLTEDKALPLWNDLLKFGGYGFNKAHSDCYSVITMQTAYLATYFPLEFYTALLSKGQSGSIQDYITDIKRCGIKILPVDVNKSQWNHSIEDGAIRLSLRCVQGVGPAAVDKIVEHQPYGNFLDFLDRSGVGKTAIEPLVLVGAFNCLFEEPNIRGLDEFYKAFCADPKLKQKKRRKELEGLFWEKTSGSTLNEPIEDLKPHEKLFYEVNLMGFSLMGSPFEVLDREKKIDAMFEGVVTDYKEFIESDLEVGMLPVVIKDIRERAQRNGQMMAFLTFGTKDGQEFSSPCFSTIWRHVGRNLKKGSVYVGTFCRREEEPDNLLVGKPGFAHSSTSALGYFLNVDEIQL